MTAEDAANRIPFKPHLVFLNNCAIHIPFASILYDISPCKAEGVKVTTHPPQKIILLRLPPQCSQ